MIVGQHSHQAPCASSICIAQAPELPKSLSLRPKIHLCSTCRSDCDPQSLDIGGCWNAPVPLGGAAELAALRAFSALFWALSAPWLPSWGLVMKAVTMWRRWIFPVAVLGSLSVMNTLTGTWPQHGRYQGVYQHQMGEGKQDLLSLQESPT